MAQDQLNLAKKLSYGVGHVLNDLSASMWFSYLLIYLHRVVNFENATAGYMMLLGQVADAFSTAFVGFESDRTKSGICNYGRRKSWHLIGLICTLISFPFMFNLCPTCENTDEWLRFYYYAPFVVIFQFGWAATQISHLSLIPQLTTCDNERVALNAIRYAFTVMSNLFVYVVTYIFLRLNSSDSSEDSHLTRADAPKFTYLSAIVCTVGLLFQIIFHLGTNESCLMSDEQIQNYSNSLELKLNWSGYLKNFRFYNVAVLYMCTRLIVNMTQVYMPMYLTDTLQLNKSSIALIPLICYMSGFASTIPLRHLNKILGCYITYFIGVCFIITCSVLFWYHDIIYKSNSITSIVSTIFLGAGSTIILVTSLGITTELIGKNTGSGAFVFGAMSFTDKLSNGITVALLQQFSPCQENNTTCSCKGYYQHIMTFLPSMCAIVSTISLISLYFNQKPRITTENIASINTDLENNEEEADALNNGNIISRYDSI